MKKNESLLENKGTWLLAVLTSAELFLIYNSMKPHQLLQFNIMTVISLIDSWLITDAEQFHTALGSADKIMLMCIILPFKFQTSAAMIENECNPNQRWICN